MSTIRRKLMQSAIENTGTLLFNIDFTNQNPVETVSNQSVTMRNARYDSTKGMWLFNESKRGTWYGSYVLLNSFQQNEFKYPEGKTFKFTLEIELTGIGSGFDRYLTLLSVGNSNNSASYTLFMNIGESSPTNSPLYPRYNVLTKITELAYPDMTLIAFDNSGRQDTRYISTVNYSTPLGRKEQNGASTYMNNMKYFIIPTGDWRRGVYTFYFKNFKIELI